MARKTTRWRPPCRCVIDYEWDDAASNEAREHVVTAIEPCAEHAGRPAAAMAATEGFGWLTFRPDVTVVSPSGVGVLG